MHEEIRIKFHTHTVEREIFQPQLCKWNSKDNNGFHEFPSKLDWDVLWEIKRYKEFGTQQTWEVWSLLLRFFSFSFLFYLHYQ